MTLPLAYNWRNLFVRKLSTTLTFVVVAVVVFVLIVLLSFAAGIRASLIASGSARNMLVLKPGATAESTSIILPEESARLAQTPGLARSAAGQALMSQELCVQTSIPRRGAEGGTANIAVRGVDPVAFEIHEDVRVVEGRMFEQGALEAVVGRAAQKRFADLALGSAIILGRAENRAYKIVGIFEAGGSALESEVWTPRTMLTDSYRRPFISSVVVRLESADAMPAAVAFVRGPTAQLEGKSEPEYYADLSSKTREIVALTTILVTIMGIGAAFAVANTMYAAVDGRRREIAMLRTIGFGRRAIILSFMIESLLLTTFACACGIGLSLLINGTRQDFLSDTTWTVLAYELRVTPQIVASALALSAMVGVAGAAAPALRAARIRILDALRKA